MSDSAKVTLAEGSGPRAMNLPRPVRVRSREAGVPDTVDGEKIELVRESWLVEDRWWTVRPLRRRYWELISVRGRNLVVFHDLAPAGHSGDGGGWSGNGAGAGWFTQLA